MTDVSSEIIHYGIREAQTISRPYIKEPPRLYETMASMIEAINAGDSPTEKEVVQNYFKKMEADDPQYFSHIKTLAKQRQERFPDSGTQTADRQLQFVIPAYREGENINSFLSTLKTQFDVSENPSFGVTFVFDYALPYRNRNEHSALQNMQKEVDSFVKNNPQYAPYIDYIYYTRQKNMSPDILPVGLARKIGEDVVIYERFQSNLPTDTAPFYLGLMDMDTGDLSSDLFDEISNSLPEKQGDTPKVIRVRGSYDKQDVSQSPQLHPLQMMWEGVTSEVGLNTKYNPFNIGRLSVVPAKELFLTGGGFAKKLPFTDEDVRKGIQIAWQLDDIETIEVQGTYATSARREVNTVDALVQLFEDNGGRFDLDALACASLIRMYSNWSNQTFRRDLGNVSSVDQTATLDNSESFSKQVPSILIEGMANASYRYTTFVMYAIDELSHSPDTPEVLDLKERFLKGDIAHFEVQLRTLDAIRNIAHFDPQRFDKLKPILERADTKARESVARILEANNIKFTLDPNTPPIYGILVDGGPDNNGNAQSEYKPDFIYTTLLSPVTPDTLADNRLELSSPFHIHHNQAEYRDFIKSQIT